MLKIFIGLIVNLSSFVYVSQTDILCRSNDKYLIDNNRKNVCSTIEFESIPDFSNFLFFSSFFLFPLFICHNSHTFHDEIIHCSSFTKKGKYILRSPLVYFSFSSPFAFLSLLFYMSS
jgi:hypothetical protein